MNAFHTSTTARVLQCAISLSLVSGGLIALLHLPPDTTLPFVLAATGVAGFVALLLGAADYTKEVVILTVTLPLGLWFHTFMVLAATTRPGLATALVVAGLGTAILAIASTWSRSPFYRVQSRTLSSGQSGLTT